MPRELRMRVFAGPNGSGKSTMFKQVQAEKPKGKPLDLGAYLNPDDIAAGLRTERSIDLTQFGLVGDEKALTAFLRKSSLVKGGKHFDEIWSNAPCDDDRLHWLSKKNIEAFAQIATQFLCDELIKHRIKFSFETVFSHPSKLAIMQKAAEAGYKVYLYYVATASPELNKDRVLTRVSQGGHDVPPHLIESRYHRSLELLLPAIRLAYHAYIFDNTGDKPVMFAEYKVKPARPYWWLSWSDVPDWYVEHYMRKEHSKDVRDAIDMVLFARGRDIR